MTTKRTRSSSPSPPPSSSGSSFLNAFATHGWISVQNVLSPSELERLQAECSALYTRQSAEAIAEQGCVLDVMAQCPMRDSDTARVESSRYLETRAKQLKSVDNDQQVFSSLLFEKLPAIAGQLMADCTESEGVFFFNEHYVVKPPKSHVEFRWHRDDDEQLAMCVDRETIRPYVSAWCALDDVSSANGALQFVSLDESGDLGEETVEKLQLRACAPVPAKAGDVLFFLSNVWHCSSSNESDAPRRAFYAQYSSEKITARPKEVTPLSFAIPCNSKRSGSLAGMATACDSDYKSSKKIKHSDL
uniref:Phytanoyl-CoA dioxygenase n=1 Tax=Phytophthora ramorum TaxID=164328 RepID=H3GIQ3_PHYRM